MQLHPLLLELLEMGQCLRMEHSAGFGGVAFYLENFGYKESGCCRLVLNEDHESFSLLGRYDTLSNDIVFVADVARVNFDLWNAYRNRCGKTWKNPDAAWLPVFKELGLVEETVTYNPTR